MRRNQVREALEAEFKVETGEVDEAAVLLRETVSDWQFADLGSAKS